MAGVIKQNTYTCTCICILHLAVHIYTTFTALNHEHYYMVMEHKGLVVHCMCG